MIETVALTILMPAASVIPAAPKRLPGPAMPVTIDQTVRLPGPLAPEILHLPTAFVEERLQLPGPAAAGAATVQAGKARIAPKKTPSAIEVLRNMTKDDRPLAVRKAFDGVTLPERDLESDIGVAVYAGR